MANQIARYTHSPDDVARTLSAFFAVRRIMRTRFAKGGKVDPSTWVRIETMKFIADHDRPMMKDIAKHLSIVAPSATSLVSGLIASGLVSSQLDARDRRTSRLTLTKKGEGELNRALANGVERLSILFSALSKSELATFNNTLERIKKSGEC